MIKNDKFYLDEKEFENDDGSKLKLFVLGKEKYTYGKFFIQDENGQFIRTKGNKLDQSVEIFFSKEESHILKDLLENI